MKSVQAYKFVSNDKPKEVSFIIDFLLDDTIGAHKYYLINCGNGTEVKKVTSIDQVIEHFDRQRMEYKRPAVPDARRLPREKPRFHAEAGGGRPGFRKNSGRIQAGVRPGLRR